MAFNCFLLCIAKQPIESNISHSSDKTFSGKQTAIFFPQRTARILNTFSRRCYAEENSLEMLLSTNGFSGYQQDGLQQMLGSVPCKAPSVHLSKAALTPTSPRGRLRSCEMCHPARMPSALYASILIRDYPTHLKQGERRRAGCQVFSRHRFRKKILQSVESSDFQQFTF